jgi:hypothetical protein
MLTDFQITLDHPDFIPWISQQFFLQNKKVSLASKHHPAAGPCIYVPWEPGHPGIPPLLGSLFLAFYYSQGYGGGITTYLHTRYLSAT